MRKVIDFERKGNVVRLYMADDSVEDWHGDDWNDVPYECNAGTVYPEYISGVIDLLVPFDCVVLEPQDGCVNSAWSKADMIDRRVPCVVLLCDSGALERFVSVDFNRANCDGSAMRLYFGDSEERVMEVAHSVHAVVEHTYEGWWSSHAQG